MRYGIFSDVHANLEALEAVIEAYQKDGIDNYLCVGDVVGYGADPQKCIEKVRSLATVTVSGNHDLASVDLFSIDYFNSFAANAIHWTRRNIDEDAGYFLKTTKLIYNNKDLTLVHSTLDEPQLFGYMNDTYTALVTLRIMKTPVVFVGHSHVAGAFIMDQNEDVVYSEKAVLKITNGCRYIINSGSVGQPRDGDSWACYCIYDTERQEVLTKRVKYDVQRTAEKIINAGLPRFLAERLFSGN